MSEARLNNDGTRAQDLIQATLKQLVEHDRAYLLRLYDTRAARTYLPKQPGDFIAVLRGVPILIECKSSVIHTSLARWVKSACESHQIAASRIWTRAGGVSVFAHFHLGSRRAELWRGRDVVDAYLGRDKLHARTPWRGGTAPPALAEGLLSLTQNEKNAYEQSTLSR